MTNRKANEGRLNRNDEQRPFLVKVVLLLAVVGCVRSVVGSDDEAVMAGEVVPPSFMAFESEPVRPMAMTPSGERVVVVNIPDKEWGLNKIPNSKGDSRFEIRDSRFEIRDSRFEIRD